MRNNNFEDVISMSEIVENLIVESENIQKKLLRLTKETDSNVLEKLDEILDDFERIDASCYLLKDLNKTLKELI